MKGRVESVVHCRVPGTIIAEGNGTPLQYSCLETPMDGGAWWATVHGVVKSRTRLNDFTFTFLFHALEKAMASHSSTLAWRIPGTAEPGGLLSMGSHGVGHDRQRLSSSSSSRHHYNCFTYFIRFNYHKHFKGEVYTTILYQLS